MEESTMLEILSRIRNCIEHDSLYIAKELTRLEIENLKDITQKKCKDTKYYYYERSCQDCKNINCSSNMKR